MLFYFLKFDSSVKIRGPTVFHNNSHNNKAKLRKLLNIAAKPSSIGCKWI